MPNYDIVVETELTKESIVEAIKHADTMKIVSVTKAIDLDDLESRVTILEDEIYEVEIFEYITGGTSGRVQIPTGAQIRLDQYEGLEDCLLSQAENNKPTDQAVISSEGGFVLCSLNADGDYLFTGIPVDYPVAIIYQVAIKGTDIGNIPLDNIINWDALSSAADVTFDNEKSGLNSNNIQDATDEIVELIKPVKVLKWVELINSWTESPIQMVHAGTGTVLKYKYGLRVYFRYIPVDYNPNEDAFYENYSNPDLTGLVASRGNNL